MHTFQRNDLLLRVHNGRVGGDGPPHDIIGICQVNDDDLVLLANFFSYADEVVRLKSKRLRCVFQCEGEIRTTARVAVRDDNAQAHLE